jgi:2-dehydropantoate 2-reductase
MRLVSPDRLRVAVLGPGGVGGLLAALLARSGNALVVLAGDGTVRAIGERGLSVQSGRFGDFHVAVQVADRLRTPIDACLITVKATQLDAALERVPADALGQGLVVPFLNGIDHVAKLRTTYPPANVVAATIRIEVARVEAGVIRHTSPFAAVDLAATDVTRDRVERLAGALRDTGLDVLVREDETAMLWDKLALLAPMALVTTHERANVGAIRTRRREETLALISEVAAVANAEGGAVDPEGIVRLLDFAPETMETSMQRDQAAGLPLELDAIGGAVIRHAARSGLAVPVTSSLVEDLRRRQAHSR